MDDPAMQSITEPPRADRLGGPPAQPVRGLRALSRQAAQLITDASKPAGTEKVRRFDPRALKNARDLPPELVALHRVEPGLAAAICSLELIRRIGLRGAEASLIAHTDEPGLGVGESFVRDELPALLQPARWLEALLHIPEEAYWDTQLHHAQVALEDFEWQMRALAARPWSELLRCWAEGFQHAAPPDKRAVPTWTAYLERSAAILAIECVASRQALKVVGSTTLRSRFLEEFNHWTTPLPTHAAEDIDQRLAGALARLGLTQQQHSAPKTSTRGSAFGIFEDRLGQTLTAPGRGKRRRITPYPESYHVYAWICDGLDEAHPERKNRVFTNELDHPRTFHAYRPAPPPCAASWPKEHIEKELRRISDDDRFQLPSTATKWDRRPCVHYRSCGGVLFPATEEVVDQILTVELPDGVDMAGYLEWALRR